MRVPQTLTQAEILVKGNLAEELVEFEPKDFFGNTFA
jgi:hypothetical protein